MLNRPLLNVRRLRLLARPPCWSVCARPIPTASTTSIVAALLASALDRPGLEAAGQALAAVAKTAASGVPAGIVSNETGHGVVSAAFRTGGATAMAANPAVNASGSATADASSSN